MAITVMQRTEMKYILTREQYEAFYPEFIAHMKLDEYGVTSIQSLYYDTPDRRLIRTSIEKPPFKEKIRLRSYGLNTNDKTVYLELKRKADGIVYKRRVGLKESEANRFLLKGEACGNGQIAKELMYFKNCYRLLEPAYLIIYERRAFYEENGDLRVTMDENIRYREYDLNLSTSLEGRRILPEGSIVMEIKVQAAIPLWLTHLLTKHKIYQGSFSKVGEAYKQTSFRPLFRRETEWKTSSIRYSIAH